MGKNLYPPGAIFCRTCGYCLHGLPTNRCPECGHDFDPADAATFLRRPRRVWVKRTVLWGSIVVLVLAIAYGGFLGWLYVGWRAEAGARGLATGQYDEVKTRPILPSSLSCLLWGDCRQWQERMDRLQIWERHLSSDDIRAIGGCRRLRVLLLYIVPLEPGDVEILCECRELEELELDHCYLRSGDLAPLSELTHLKKLDVGLNGLDDVAMPVVARLKSLAHLDMVGSAITDAGLANLAALPHLDELALVGCHQITDGAVHHLSRLTGLKKLDLYGTHLTPTAIDQLRSALPQCAVIGP